MEVLAGQWDRVVLWDKGVLEVLWDKTDKEDPVVIWDKVVLVVIWDQEGQ